VQGLHLALTHTKWITVKVSIYFFATVCQNPPPPPLLPKINSKIQYFSASKRAKNAKIKIQKKR
jgi:hypothetical protein